MQRSEHSDLGESVAQHHGMALQLPILQQSPAEFGLGLQLVGLEQFELADGCAAPLREQPVQHALLPHALH